MQKFSDYEELEEFITRPNSALIRDMEHIEGDLLILGASGKMGPQLCRMAKRASPDKRVVAVARFSDSSVEERLKAEGVETIRCDILNATALENLPQLENVLFMAGKKFGSSGAESETWAVNTFAPALTAQRFKHSRIVVFSTGCVYPFAEVESGGCKENTPLMPPPGDYAWSCVGRERTFQYFSQKWHTPGCIFRLNYAIELRYGVLFDIAQKVFGGEEVDVTMGHVNVIWQGDANARALRSLAHCATPMEPLNVSGSNVLSVRDIAESFGQRMGKKALIVGSEAKTGWVVNTDKSYELFGEPVVSLENMLDWVAAWVMEGKESLGKPTRFEVRDGQY